MAGGAYTRGLLPAVLAASVLLAQGCGGDSADDLAFFFAAQARDEAQHPGTLFTNHWTVAVGGWEPTPDARGPYWRLWAAERFRAGRAASPKELVTDWRYGSYVAYLRRASPRAIRAVERCFDPVAGKRGAPVPLRDER